MDKTGAKLQKTKFAKQKKKEHSTMSAQQTTDPAVRFTATG